MHGSLMALKPVLRPEKVCVCTCVCACHHFNPLPPWPREHSPTAGRLQRLPRDNSRPAVPASPLGFAVKQSRLYYLHIVLVDRSPLEANDIALFTAFCF